MKGVKWIFGGLGFTTGVASALYVVLVWKKDIDFKAELDVGDLIAAMVTLGVAICIGYYLQAKDHALQTRLLERDHTLQTRGEVDRAERERLVVRTEDVAESVGDVRNAEVGLARGEAKLEDVLSELQRFSIGLSGLERRYTTYGVANALQSQLQSAKGAFLEYRVLIGESTLVDQPPTQAERDQKYNALEDELDAMVRDLSRMEWPANRNGE